MERARALFDCLTCWNRNRTADNKRAADAQHVLLLCVRGLAWSARRSKARCVQSLESLTPNFRLYSNSESLCKGINRLGQGQRAEIRPTSQFLGMTLCLPALRGLIARTAILAPNKQKARSEARATDWPLPSAACLGHRPSSRPRRNSACSRSGLRPQPD
jgi:hypothetical protein